MLIFDFENVDNLIITGTKKVGTVDMVSSFHNLHHSCETTHFVGKGHVKSVHDLVLFIA